jgi:hypothetical protein
MNEKDYRHEQIPGGFETYSRETRSNSGKRVKDGRPTNFRYKGKGELPANDRLSSFRETSQDISFKREQEVDRVD